MTLQPYSSKHPTREAVAALSGNVVVEFGVDWCPHCQGAAGPVAAALGAAVADAPGALQYLRLEDERTRPLGRSFKVKLWPTLLFLRDGVEVARVVRPTTAAEVMTGLEQLGSHREVQP